MSKFNIELLRNAVDWARAESEKEDGGKWNQTVWASGGVVTNQKVRDNNIRYRVVSVDCQSSFCIAGNICASKGDTFVIPTVPGIPQYGYVDAIDDVIPKGGKHPRGIFDRARGLLGITKDEAGALFDPMNSLADIERIAADIASKRGEIL